MAQDVSTDRINWTKTLWIGAVIMLLAIVSLPTLIILIPGMLPTGVARICDRTEQRYATLCVGGLNLCGVFPYLAKLWTDDHSITAAVNVISDLFALLVMYSAAGFGCLMFLAIPPVVSTFLTALAQRRVTILRATQELIVNDWGPEVATVDEEMSTVDTIPSA